MKFDRYRAYTEAEGTKSKWFQNTATLEKTRRVVETWPTEEVAFEGKGKDGVAEFDAGDVVVTRVVFLAGSKDDEVVVGCVDVNASGAISVTCPDPADAQEVPLG